MYECNRQNTFIAKGHMINDFRFGQTLLMVLGIVNVSPKSKVCEIIKKFNFLIFFNKETSYKYLLCMAYVRIVIGVLLKSI